MRTVTIMVGLPMSGKSTYAKKFMRGTKNTVYIECDMIRMMLSNKNDKYKAFDKKNESLVWSIFNNTVQESLRHNKNILIGNTNCKLSTLKGLISTLGDAKIHFLVMNVSNVVCRGRLGPEHEHMLEIIDRMDYQLRSTLTWIEKSEYTYDLISNMRMEVANEGKS